MEVATPSYHKEQKRNSRIGSLRLAPSVRLAVLILIALLSSAARPASANNITDSTSPTSPKTPTTPITTDTLTVSARAQARIDFKVNLINFDKNYHGNDSSLERMLARVDSMVLDPRVRVRRVTVVGTASPEGPYLNNVRLAAGRARAFVAILRARYSFTDSIYAVSTIPEDWEGMRVMLETDSTIPYGAAVLGFLDETADLDVDTRERRLKSLDGGAPYASMRDRVLPYLRRASVLVDYDSRRLRSSVSSPVPACLDQGPLTAVADFAPVAVRLAAPAPPRQRFFALKTNLLWDAALCANLGFELELWPRWSLDVPVWYSPYDITRRWRIRLLATQPELRYWPKVAGEGHYFGVHTSVIGFNVSFAGDYRYQDPNYAAFGLGLGYGFAFHLDKDRRWGMEAQIGAGYISYKWIKYHNTGRNGGAVSRGGGTYWGPTRAGITISYKFYRQRGERRWMKW